MLLPGLCVSSVGNLGYCGSWVVLLGHKVNMVLLCSCDDSVGLGKRMPLFSGKSFLGIVSKTTPKRNHSVDQNGRNLVQPPSFSPITASTLPGVGRTISLQMVKMFWWHVKQNTKIGNVCGAGAAKTAGGKGKIDPEGSWTLPLREGITATPLEKRAHPIRRLNRRHRAGLQNSTPSSRALYAMVHSKLTWSSHELQQEP